MYQPFKLKKSQDNSKQWWTKKQSQTAFAGGLFAVGATIFVGGIAPSQVIEPQNPVAYGAFGSSVLFTQDITNDGVVDIISAEPGTGTLTVTSLSSKGVIDGDVYVSLPYHDGYLLGEGSITQDPVEESNAEQEVASEEITTEEEAVEEETTTEDEVASEETTTEEEAVTEEEAAEEETTTEDEVVNEETASAFNVLATLQRGFRAIRAEAQASPEEYGYAMIGLDDLDGNGVEEIAVSAPGIDTVFVHFMNSDGTISSTTPHVGLANSRFGHALAFGSGYMFVGSSDKKVYMYSLNPDGTEASAFAFTGTEESYGEAIAAHDGYVAIGTPKQNKVYLYEQSGSVLTQKVLLEDNLENGSVLSGSSDEYGYALAFHPDLSGDTTPELLVGAPGFESKGAVFVHSFNASTFALTSTVTISDETLSQSLSNGDMYGASINTAKDVDEDGVKDLLIGAPGTDIGAIVDAGTVYVHVFDPETQEVFTPTAFTPQNVPANNTDNTAQFVTSSYGAVAFQMSATEAAGHLVASPGTLQRYEEDATIGVTGYAWGDAVGWVNFSPASGGVAMSCATGGIGTLSGYAWSQNAGWLNYGPFTGGSGATQVTIDVDGYHDGYAWSEGAGWLQFDCTTKGNAAGAGSCLQIASVCAESLPACQNGIDDDGDGIIDYTNGDPGCSSLTDTDETDPTKSGKRRTGTLTSNGSSNITTLRGTETDDIISSVSKITEEVSEKVIEKADEVAEKTVKSALSEVVSISEEKEEEAQEIIMDAIASSGGDSLDEVSKDIVGKLVAQGIISSSELEEVQKEILDSLSEQQGFTEGVEQIAEVVSGKDFILSADRISRSVGAALSGGDFISNKERSNAIDITEKIISNAKKSDTLGDIAEEIAEKLEREDILLEDNSVVEAILLVFVERLDINEVANTEDVANEEVSKEVVEDSNKTATRLTGDLISAGVLDSKNQEEVRSLVKDSLEDFDLGDSIEDLAKDISRGLVAENKVSNNEKFKAQDVLIKAIAFLQGVLTVEGDNVQYKPLTSEELSSYSRDVVSVLVTSRFISGSEFESAIAIVESVLSDGSLVNEEVSRISILVTDKLQAEGKINSRIRVRALQSVERILNSRLNGRIAVATGAVETSEIATVTEEEFEAKMQEALVNESKKDTLIAASALAAISVGYQGAGLSSPIDIETMAQLFTSLESKTELFSRAKSIEGILPIIAEAYKAYVPVDIRPVIGLIAKIEGNNSKTSVDIALAKELRLIVGAYYYPATSKSCMVDEFSERIEKRTIKPVVGKIQQFLSQALAQEVARDSVFGSGVNTSIMQYQTSNAETLDPYRLIASLERRDGGADVVALQSLYSRAIGVSLDTDGVYGKGTIDNTLLFLKKGYSVSDVVAANGIWNYPTYQRANEIVGCQFGGELVRNGILRRLFSSLGFIKTA